MKVLPKLQLHAGRSERAVRMEPVDYCDWVNHMYSL